MLLEKLATDKLQAAADDLRSIRTALVKAKLAGDFEAAFDLMLFQLGRSVFALDIAIRETVDRPTVRMNDEDFAAWSPGEAMLEDRSGLSFDWLTIEDDGESFAALRELSQAEKQALFAACVARTVKAGSDFFDHVIDCLQSYPQHRESSRASPAETPTRITAFMLNAPYRRHRRERSPPVSLPRERVLDMTAAVVS